MSTEQRVKEMLLILAELKKENYNTSNLTQILNLSISISYAK